MYDIVWDPETGGILLQEAASEGLKSAIRPVFHEELDLLGFQEKWRYPRVKEPLLWATSVGRLYFYRGECVAEARGGSFFQTPTIRYFKEDLELTPVDVPAMLAKNATLMRSLTQEAIDFIRRAHDRERPRADIAAVAFSGGKDSLTLLDLVQRALCPDEYVVVFNDTQMEISPTYEAVERAKEKWPHLRFYTSRCHKPPEQTWREFGPPSRIHRWCCSVHKSVPNLLLLRQLAGNPAARALIYDGVRGEESPARAAYDRISPGGKHGTQVNVRPILKWNAGEIFLYLLDRDILFNHAYRYGAVRVGCAICPLASNWWNSLVNTIYTNDCNNFLRILSDYFHNLGKSGDDYIDSGAWKARAGGNNLGSSSKVVEIIGHNIRKYVIRYPSPFFYEWLKILGNDSKIGKGSGYIFLNKFSLRYDIDVFKDCIEFIIHSANKLDLSYINNIRGILKKAAYCVGCKACQVECPLGAINFINDKLCIDSTKCVHCFKCLIFNKNNCLAAKSLKVSQEDIRMKGIDRYKHFGLKKSWLQEFYFDYEKWWRQNSLGNRQFESMKVWLQESEIIKNNKITDIGILLSNIGISNDLFWLILWVNLARNSNIIKWFINNTEWDKFYRKNELIEMLGDSLSYATRDNAIRALLALFRDTPIGSSLGLGVVSKVDSRSICVLRKGKGIETNPVAVLYCIYRYAEIIGRHDLYLKEFYDASIAEGPYKLFGILKDDLKKILLGLSSKYKSIIAVEFAKDLDNIYLYRNFTSLDIIKNCLNI